MLVLRKETSKGYCMKLPDNIYQKIKKLFNHAKGAEKIGSLAEAENAMLKVNKILMDYNLSLKDLELDEAEKAKILHVIIPGNEVVFLPANEGQWVIMLYFLISDINMCQGISHERDGFTIVGEEHNIEITKFLCSQLLPRIKELASKETAEWAMLTGHDHPILKRRFRKDFLMGVVKGIGNKLYAQRDEFKKSTQEEKPEEENPFGLMVISNVEAIEAYVKDNGFEVHEHDIPETPPTDGMIIGFFKGQGMEINKGLK